MTATNKWIVEFREAIAKWDVDQMSHASALMNIRWREIQDEILKGLAVGDEVLVKDQNLSPHRATIKKIGRESVAVEATVGGETKKFCVSLLGVTKISHGA